MWSRLSVIQSWTGPMTVFHAFTEGIYKPGTHRIGSSNVWKT